MPTTSSVILVDHAALRGNLVLLRRAIARVAALGGAQPPRIWPIVKADAYGLGAVPVARTLAAAGSRVLAVSTPRQAAQITGAVPGPTVVILMPCDVEDLAVLHGTPLARIELTVHDEPSLQAAVELGRSRPGVVRVHLELDTGIGRAGAAAEEAEELLAAIEAAPELALAGVSTHLAAADMPTAQTDVQRRRFEQTLDAWRDRLPPGCVRHAANSFGLFRSSRLHFDALRVGLALFGYASEEFAGPEGFELGRDAAALRPVLRWMSRIAQVKRLGPGATVGYGATWAAPAPHGARIATVPVGYADGYPRSLGNAARVRVVAGGELRPCPVVGRVSMDQITVDVSALPPETIGVGGLVEVVAADATAPNHLPTLAHAAGTIAHELLVRLSPRVPRQHLRDAAATSPEALAEAERAIPVSLPPA